jgi:hypothetical protein
LATIKNFLVEWKGVVSPSSLIFGRLRIRLSQKKM